MYTGRSMSSLGDSVLRFLDKRNYGQNFPDAKGYHSHNITNEKHLITGHYYHSLSNGV